MSANRFTGYNSYIVSLSVWFWKRDDQYNICKRLEEEKKEDGNIAKPV